MSTKRFLTAGAIALGTAATFTLTAGTAIAAPYTTSPLGTVSNSNPGAGTPVTVMLTGFAASEAVSGDLLSRRVHVFDVTTNATGSASATFTIPAHFECGAHVILAQGATGDTSFTDITVGGDCTRPGEGRGGGCADNCGGDHHRHHCEGNCRGDHWASCIGICDWDGLGDPGFGDDGNWADCEGNCGLDLDVLGDDSGWGDDGLLAGFGLAGAAASVLLVRHLRRRND